jgi:hypothetical protein
MCFLSIKVWSNKVYDLLISDSAYCILGLVIVGNQNLNVYEGIVWCLSEIVTNLIDRPLTNELASR